MQWNTNSPTTGAPVIARAEILDWTITVEYPADERHLSVEGYPSGRCTRNIQNPKNQGDVRISGSVVISRYKMDENTAVDSTQHLLDARFTRRNSDSTSPVCLSWVWSGVGDGVALDATRIC